MTLEEYEKSHIQLYSDFAETIARILAAAIDNEKTLMEPIITHRAKSVDSLRKKLALRGIPENVDIRDFIKDISGCRAVFYTATDANSQTVSRLIYSNFGVEESKQHYPSRYENAVADLYVGHHFCVKLTDDRVTLPEYRKFDGLKCEIQVQSILNHAWSTIEHDIIYKAPELDKFGESELKSIGVDLARIHKKYITTAVHELDSVMHRFGRLLKGKTLFDNDLLNSIPNASNNNLRLEAIRSFQESVLRYYDNIPSMLVEIVQKLMDAAKTARDVKDIPIETEFGSLPPKTFSDVLEAICEVLSELRYQNINAPIILEATFELFSLTRWDVERKPVLELAKKLSRNDIEIWEKVGPYLQARLVDFLENMPLETLFDALPVTSEILSNALSTEVEGIRWSSSSMLIRNGAVQASTELSELRSRAIKILIGLFEFCKSSDDRRLIVQPLFQAMRRPHHGKFTNELAKIITSDSQSIIQFFTKKASKFPFDERQSLEHELYWHYTTRINTDDQANANTELKEILRESALAALQFRDVVNADPEFQLYKILVGFESVFPEAWENPDFDYVASENYRTGKVDALLNSLEDDDETFWRLRLNKFSETKSNDWATFPVLGSFIRGLSKTKPEWALKWITDAGSPLLQFFPGMLSGLLESSETQKALALINQWIERGDHLDNIANQMRYANPFQEERLIRVLQKAIELEDLNAVITCIAVADRQFEEHPGQLIDQVLIPSVLFLARKSNTTWHKVILGASPKIIEALNREQSKIVLDALIAVPRLQSQYEFIVAAITKNWPVLGLEHLTQRRKFKPSMGKISSYDAIPYRPSSLSKALSVIPDQVLLTLRDWFTENPDVFRFDGATLLASMFQGYTKEAQEHLEMWIEKDVEFVIECLYGFEGAEAIYPTVHKIVEFLPAGSEDLRTLDFALDASNIVEGEFGFIKLYNYRLQLLTSWLDDPSPKIRSFANARAEHLKKAIVAETQRVEAGIAARKLRFGEDLEGDEPVD